MSENKAKLYAKMAQAMGELKRVAKSGRNQHFGYDYATSEDVADTVREVLAKVGLAHFMSLASVKQENGRTEALFDITLACSESGESVTGQWLGESIDKQDKGFSKAATAAQKYFLLKTFIISTGDDPDPDSDGEKPKTEPTKTKKNTPPPAPAPTNGNAPKWPDRPWEAETLREAINVKAAGYKGKEQASEKQRKFCLSSLQNVVNNDDDKRHSLTAYLFGVESTSDLNGAQCSALIDWVGANKDNEYQPNGHAIDEAERVVKARVIELGQKELL